MMVMVLTETLRSFDWTDVAIMVSIKATVAERTVNFMVGDVVKWFC
jgi:hypothetical protein